jgi:hypothetical protein
MTPTGAGASRRAFQGGWWLALVLCAVVLVALDVAASQAPWLNNGDHWRVAGKWVDLADWQAWQDCKPVQFQPGLPRSTGAALFALNAAAHHALGACMVAEAHGALLALLMLAGVVALWSGGGLTPWRGLALLLATLAFAPMMFSHYQEAVLLPLLPWALLAIDLLWHRSRLLPFLCVGVLLLAVKAQMALLLPLLLAVLWAASHVRRIAPAPALLVAAALSLVAAYLVVAQRHHGDANGYNRWFNGVGWTLQGVAEWPARSFSERQAHFEAHREALIQRSAAQVPGPAQAWMGTSYWPDGLRLKDSAQWPELSPVVASTWWLQRMLSSPTLAVSWAVTAWRVTLQSDYTLAYLQSRRPPSAWLESPRQAVLAHAGWLWLLGLLGLVWASWRLRSGVVLAAAVWWAAMPWLVVAGDGYYEFEKHLLTYLVCLPLFLAGGGVGQLPSPSAKGVS